MHGMRAMLLMSACRKLLHAIGLRRRWITEFADV